MHVTFGNCKTLKDPVLSDSLPVCALLKCIFFAISCCAPTSRHCIRTTL